MANTSSNVTTGKPVSTGAIFVEASSSAQLPTDTSTALTGFTGLGFVSEDGLANNNSFTSNDIKEWGGATVLTIESDYTDTFTFTLIEALNVDVLKEVFGSSNVTGTLSTGIAVSVMPAQHVKKKWVIDMIMSGNVAKRICIPAGAISSVGEIAYRNDEAVGYEITLTCTPDSSGKTHYEYMKAPATTGGAG